MTQSPFFKRGLTGLNSEFSFSKTSCLTKAEEPRLPYYLPIAEIMYLSYLPTPPLGQDMTQSPFFKRSLTGLNSEFSFS